MHDSTQQPSADAGDSPRTADSKARKISVRKLWLDPNNYRLIHEPDYVPVEAWQVKDKQVARRTFRLLAGERNQHITDLIESFRANGYLPVDMIQVRDLGDGDYLVVEGNRRVAALKHLAQQYEEKTPGSGLAIQHDHQGVLNCNISTPRLQGSMA